MFGASPVHFLSRSGDRFTSRQVAASPGDARADSVDRQTDIVHPDARRDGVALTPACSVCRPDVIHREFEKALDTTRRPPRVPV